jgi:hypothetical protein
LKVAIQALKDVRAPIAYLRRQAEAQGCTLDGRNAIALSSDPAFLKDIATDALRTLKALED